VQPAVDPALCHLPSISQPPAHHHPTNQPTYLPTPPRRFRPPSVLGDTKYEHAQNVLLQKILNAALSLQSSRETIAKVRCMVCVAWCMVCAVCCVLCGVCIMCAV